MLTAELGRTFLAAFDLTAQVEQELTLQSGMDRGVHFNCYLCRMGTAEVAGAMLMKAPRSDLYREIVGLMSKAWEK